MTGLLVSPELLGQLERMHRRDVDAHGVSVDPQSTAVDQQRRKIRPTLYPMAMITDVEILAGTFLDPQSGLATFCEWSTATGQYVQTSTQYEVYNHSSDDIAADTPGIAIPVDGHLIFFPDCGPWDDRPDPPA